MNIDFNKKVSELTPEEAIFLGDKAKASLTKDSVDSNIHQEYPKFLPDLNIRVLSEQEEKEAYIKSNEALRKANEEKVKKDVVIATPITQDKESKENK